MCSSRRRRLARCTARCSRTTASTPTRRRSRESRGLLPTPTPHTFLLSHLLAPSRTFSQALERAATRGDEADAADDNRHVLRGDYRRLLLRPKNLQYVYEVAAEGGAPAGGDGAPAAAVRLSFDLPPGAYATMALREVMKLEPPRPTHKQHIRF